MEAEKPQELQLSFWRPESRRCKFQFKIQQAHWPRKLIFQSEFKGQERSKSQAVRQEFPPKPSGPIQGWMGSTCIREGQRLYAVYRFKMSISSKKYPHRHTQNNVWWNVGAFLSPVSWHIKLIITGTHYSITNIICNTKELKTISLSVHFTSIH